MTAPRQEAHNRHRKPKISEDPQDFALVLAIGRLQVELGRDQRIHANSDIIDSSVDLAQASWLGAWENWRAEQNDRPAPQFRSWLVFGDPVNLESPGFPTNPGPVISLGGRAWGKPVSVPLVSLENGGLPYWISDENAKARIGPSFVTTDQEFIELASIDRKIKLGATNAKSLRRFARMSVFAFRWYLFRQHLPQGHSTFPFRLGLVA